MDTTDTVGPRAVFTTPTPDPNAVARTLLVSWPGVQADDQAAHLDAFVEGFIAGFAASREGFNGETSSESAAPEPDDYRADPDGVARQRPLLERLAAKAWAAAGRA